MSATTSIEWTDRTWNPTTGCDKVSPGCAHCYAEVIADRFWPTQYPRIPIVDPNKPEMVGGKPNSVRPRVFTDVQTHDSRLLEPLSWRKPSKVFVNSMSDLFHEDVPDAFIDRVFAVMMNAGRHTFQVLTKRPERMLRYLLNPDVQYRIEIVGGDWGIRMPFRNVWLGVSVENQHFADERIPLLLQAPAAVHFVSAEPLLGPLTLAWERYPAYHELGYLRGGLDWVIVGGESGPGARPFDLMWARSIVQQCKSAGVPVFVKQLGARPLFHDGGGRTSEGLKDRKGGDPTEWPEDLRVRQFPNGGQL